MRAQTTYRQFCPIARACEVVTERWTPLVLRELLCGSTRFNELKRGLPHMSPSLLTQRLRELEMQGIVQRVVEGSSIEYRLTPAGEDLRPIVESLGHWGKKWLEQELTREEMDPALLVWDMHRRVATSELPEERTVVRFDFRSVRGKQSRFWLIFERPTADVCFHDPGQEPALYVTADLRALIDVWMGTRSFTSALSDRSIVLDGPRDLCRRFPSWFNLSVFADSPQRRKDHRVPL
jgi:DNA-binding HxlR family transcriptional regulator